MAYSLFSTLTLLESIKVENGLAQLIYVTFSTFQFHIES